MTEVMAQQSLDLPPSSRQDVVSALLNDYGSSFGRGNTSPYSYSPVPAMKELPPPPPEKERNYINDKPLPSAGHMSMSMRFQLRVDEPYSPASPNGSPSSVENQPKRIVSRSLSRSSKPPSLKLFASNGSTAIVPPTPGRPIQTSTPTPAARPSIEEEKSLPPPPPEKSELRQQRRMSVGSQSSTERSRKDSLQSQEEKKKGAENAGPMKRKPVPKFTSLAELGNGPRGGKGGPMPLPRSRKQSVEQVQDEQSSEHPKTAVESRTVDFPDRPSKSSTYPRNGDMAPRDAPPVVNQLPPTPDENPVPPPPPPPRKPFVGMGLPSNPRAKGAETPKHIRGKSSTGFDIMKGAKSAPPVGPTLNTITPGPTPSPRQLEQAPQTLQPSPISPVNEVPQRRPFSFESIAPPSPPRTQQQPARAPASARPASPVSPLDPPTNPTAFPPRSTSRAPPAFASLPSQQRTRTPPQQPPTTSTQPRLETRSEPRSEPRSRTPSDATPPTPSTPEFTPLTIKPAPTAAPRITPKHLHCYSRHSTYVWSRNDFQPMACMVCKANDRERKWACVWCYLRICVACSAELARTPGRDLRAVLEKRGVDPEEGTGARKTQEEAKRHDSGNPSVVVWEAEGEEEEDFA